MAALRRCKQPQLWRVPDYSPELLPGRIAVVTSQYQDQEVEASIREEGLHVDNGR